jgi:short-subunit dehydrogenase
MPTVLILGATSDIGIALAKKWALNKFDVILAARRPELLDALESDIRVRYGVNCTSRVFDAIEYDSHRHFFDSLQPKPDVSICVFGIMDNEDQAYSDWRLTERMINTNFTGAFLDFKCHQNTISTKKRNNHRDQLVWRDRGCSGKSYIPA